MGINANVLLVGNLAWYAILALAFCLDSNWPKATYFLGAFILTIGVFYMR